MLSLIAFLMAPSAHAFESVAECNNHMPAWSNLGPSFVLNTFSFSGSSTHAVFDEALSEWHEDQVPGINFRPALGLIFDSTSLDGNDGQNIIAAIDSGPCLSSSSTGQLVRPPVAETDVRFSSEIWTCLALAHIEEADIVLNSCYSFELENDYFDINDPEARANPTAVDLEAIMVHEFGHAVGFDHVPGHAAMRESVGAGPVVAVDDFLDGRQYAASEDDRQGLRALYGDPLNGSPTQTDLSVASYRVVDRMPQTRCSALTSQIRPTPFADLEARLLAEGRDAPDCPSNLDTDPLPDLVMYGSQDVDVEFTYFQLGNMANPSTEATITLRSTPDGPVVETLASFSTVQHPNTPHIDSRTVTVPLGLDPGIYYLVAEVDPNGAVSESDEGNNLAVWNQRIVIEEVPIDCGCSATGGAQSGLFGLLLSAMTLGWRRRR